MLAWQNPSSDPLWIYPKCNPDLKEKIEKELKEKESMKEEIVEFIHNELPALMSQKKKLEFFTLMTSPTI